VKKSEAPHINKDSSPLSVLMLFFTEIFHLLVEQTNLFNALVSLLPIAFEPASPRYFLTLVRHL
jgi:hypothetical protein